MKTSLVSTAASSSSASIKADPAPRLKSVTVYFRGRKMVLMQRPQRRLSLLLCRMLRRSMLNLLGRLPVKLPAPIRKTLSAGALCAMALASATTAHATATVDTLPVNTLPTNPAVVYGTAGVSTTGNQMNVDIGTNKAIINWGSFSIGSQAGVDFHFDNATSTSSVLNRVIGNDPSKIMGSLTSNGKVFLINSAGILVGKTAKIDVAGFVASTLNITNSDFLAGKMSFHDQHRHHHPAGDVVIEEDGAIKTKEGGSVYLIGANVENGGVITSPKGEVLLAAGHSVDLVDTGTPGVKINVKGDKGKVTNLGQIIAATGTIGFGAALIQNSGVINASSVDKQGGRIFLRALKDLTTTETSSINADGTVGGNVVLYADGTSIIDGDVSALGNVDGNGGAGGYVDTSGKTALAVHYAPRVGKGGEWFIDPANVDIVTNFSQDGLLQQILNWLGIVSLNGTHSEIEASSINTTLNAGTSVTIATGVGSNTGNDAGDITIANGVNITKTSANGPATLTLNAANNITISDNVHITDDGTAAHGLGLVMNAGYSDTAAHTNTGSITTSTNTTIQVSNGFEAHAASYNMAGGSLTSSGTFIMDAPLTTSGSAAITINGTGSTAGTMSSVVLGGTSSLTVQNSANVTLSGAISGTGTLNLGANATDTTSRLDAGSNAVSVKALHQNAGNLSGNATLTVNGTFDQSGGAINFHDVNVTQNSGTLTVGNVTASNGLTLKANAGSIAQAAASPLSANALTATATAGIALNNAANSVNTFTATNSSSGTITYNGTGNLALGSVDNGNRNVSISTGNGAITQLAAMTAGDVGVSATSGISLANAANQISSFSANNSTSGDIALSTSSNVILETVANSAAGGNVGVTAGGQIGINGAVSALNQVSLTSTLSNIQQAANLGSITAANLVVEAQTGISLGASSNKVNAFSAANHASGDILFTNNQGGSATAMTLGDVNQAGGGNVTITHNGAITAAGTVSNTAGAVTIESESGNIQLGNVSAASVSVLADSGSISQAGTLTSTGTANVSATSGITLDNTSNEIAALTASNSGAGDITVKTHGGNHLTLNNVFAANGNIAITNTLNDIELQGNLSTGTAGNAISLTSGAGIVQSGASVVTTDQLSASAHLDIDIGLTGNNIGKFLAGSDTGHISLVNAGALATGAISAGAGKYVTVTSGNKLTVGDQISGSDITLTSTSGDIAVNGALQATGTATLTANSGAITQTAGITANALVANANTGITLINTGNSISHEFSANNSTSGNISLVNHYGEAADALTLGAINNGARNVTINTNHNLLQTADGITAGTLDVTASGGINLNADNHVSTFIATNPLGNVDFVNSGNLTVQTVSASSGNVHVSTTGTLTVDTGATVTGQGITLESYGGFVEGNGEGGEGGEGGGTQVPPQRINADMTIKGQLTATGSSGVSLSADGAITQTSSSGISAPILVVVASAGGDITLTGAGNHFSELEASPFNGNITARSSGSFAVGLTNYNGSSDITSTDGNITLYNINASDLTLHADHGSVSQAMFYGLNADTLNVSARDGINLNVTCSTVSIGNFSATNTGTGDIKLKNSNGERDITTLVSISNSNGNISVDNTGAMQTTGLITAPHGSVTLQTHSPLTIGSGGINAGNGVSLLAGNGFDPSDAVVVNGAIHNASGVTTILGNTVGLNGAIYGPTPVFPGPNAPTHGSGYALNPVDNTSTPTVPTVPPSTSSTIDQSVASTSNNVNNSADTTVPVTTTQSNTPNSASNQTAGGGDGEFGGDKDDGKAKDGKSGKPLPMCT